jgi:hypothetical protein
MPTKTKTPATKTKTPTTKTPAPKSPGKLAYEQQRAAKAGKSHDEWVKEKAKEQAAAAKKTAPKPAKKPGLISRLLDKAHKPI